MGNFPNPSRWLAGSLGECKDARLHSRRLRYLQIHSGELYLTYSMAIFLADSKKKKKKKKKKPWSTSGKSHHVETVSLQRSDRDRALSLVRSVFLSDAEWTVTCSGCCLCVSQKISHSKCWMISKLDLPKCTVYSWLCLARFLKCLSAFIHTEKHTCVCSYTDKNSIHTHIH